MKKILFLVMSVFLISSFTFAEEVNQQKEIKQIKIQRAGPTSAPDIVGPPKGPPSREEIKILKCTMDEDFIGTDYCTEKKEPIKEENIFEIISEWFSSIFSW